MVRRQLDTQLELTIILLAAVLLFFTFGVWFTVFVPATLFDTQG